MTTEQVNLQEMNELGAKIAHLREEESKAAAFKKGITVELEKAEERATQILAENGLKNYRSPSGLMSLAFLTSAKTPKTPEDKSALFEYLKSIGRYDDMVSVNSQTLNSFYKERLELAKEQGLSDVEIPGVTEVTVLARLSFTRPK